MHHPRVLTRTLLTLIATAPALLAVETAPTPAPAPASSLDSVASHVGESLRSIRWGAYGEFHYNNFQGQRDDMLDLHRFVLLGEATIAEHWRLVSEIEIEHVYVRGNSSTSTPPAANDPYAKGYLAVEQGYLGWQFSAHHEFKVGMMLVPISIMNMYHEPTVFHGVERPFFDGRIVPSTWHEIGVGLAGDVSSELTYEVAIQTGLNSATFSAGNGFRNGRQRGAEASAEDLMATARLDWRPIDGLWIAPAINGGGADQRNASEGGEDGIRTVLGVLEARYAIAGWETGLSLAEGRINRPQLAGPANLPRRFNGATGFVAYDILRPFALDVSDQLFAFVRYEDINNHAEVQEGTAHNRALNTAVIQGGLTWRPNTWVTFKGDYQRIENDDETRADVWNLGAGFAF
jgi:hypothetical protein